MRVLCNRRGFTLVEVLIVVVILGMMAAVAIPRVVNVSDDARAVTLERNMNMIRNAAELYYHQHNETWPGALTSTGIGPVSTTLQARRSFERQLLNYTSANGVYAVVKGSATPYGPYLKKGIPENPNNGLNSVLVDYTVTDIRHNRTNGTTGWKFYAKTGVLLPNHRDNSADHPVEDPLPDITEL